MNTLKFRFIWLAGAIGCLAMPSDASAQQPAALIAQPVIVEVEPPAAMVEALKAAAPQAVIGQTLKSVKGGISERFRMRFTVGDYAGMANLAEVNGKVVGIVEQAISSQEIPAAALAAFRAQVRDGNIAQPMKVTALRGATITVTYQWRTGGYSGWEVDPDNRRFSDGASRVSVAADGSRIDVQSPIDLLFPAEPPTDDKAQRLKTRLDKPRSSPPAKPEKLVRPPKVR